MAAETSSLHSRGWHLRGRAEAGDVTRGIVWLYVAGSGLSLAAVALFVGFCWHSARVSDRLFSLDANAVVGIEFLLFTLATAAIMIAQFSHRGRAARNPVGGISGTGSNLVDVARRSYLERVLWMLVPLTAWAAIFFTPLLIANSGQPWDWDVYHPGTYAEIVVIANAFAAAGAFGAMLLSLIKALCHDLADRLGLTPTRQTVVRKAKKGKGTGKTKTKVVTSWPNGQRSSGLWLFLSYMWRLELVFGFVAVGFLGCLPYALVGGEGYPTADLWAPITAAVLGAAAVVIAANSWRSGEPLTTAESLTTGVL
jgi:hypothetical protein